jgi:hypothetical protein
VSTSKQKINETDSKPFSDNINAALKKPAAVSGTGCMFVDDVDVSLICPTCQLREIPRSGAPQKSVNEMPAGH